MIKFGKIYKWSGDYFVPFRKDRYANFIHGINLNNNTADWKFDPFDDEWELCDPEDVPEKILEIYNDPLFEIESLRKIPE